jgi:hypothetical protein
MNAQAEVLSKHLLAMKIRKLYINSKCRDYIFRSATAFMHDPNVTKVSADDKIIEN